MVEGQRKRLLYKGTSPRLPFPSLQLRMNTFTSSWKNMSLQIPKVTPNSKSNTKSPLHMVAINLKLFHHNYLMTDLVYGLQPRQEKEE